MFISPPDTCRGHTQKPSHGNGEIQGERRSFLPPLVLATPRTNPHEPQRPTHFCITSISRTRRAGKTAERGRATVGARDRFCHPLASDGLRRFGRLLCGRHLAVDLVVVEGGVALPAVAAQRRLVWRMQEVDGHTHFPRGITLDFEHLIERSTVKSHWRMASCSPRDSPNCRSDPWSRSRPRSWKLRCCQTVVTLDPCGCAGCVPSAC
jgi:hypothetical protein